MLNDGVIPKSDFREGTARSVPKVAALACSHIKRKSYPEIHLFSRFYYRSILLYFNSNQYFQVLLNPDSTIPPSRE